MRNPWKFLITNRVKKNSMDGKLKGNGSTRPALDVDIDAIWLEKQYHNQNGRCYYFPFIPLDPQSVFTSRNPRTMSVERLDDSKGYTKDNVVLTCRFSNLGLVNTSPEGKKEFISEFIKKLKEGGV